MRPPPRAHCEDTVPAPHAIARRGKRPGTLSATMKRPSKQVLDRIAMDLFSGAYRISDMSEWPMALVEESGPATIRIRKNGTGTFAFASYRAEFIGRIRVHQRIESFVFRWEGLDNDMPVEGIGYVGLVGQLLVGTIHDETAKRPFEFTARRVKTLPRRRSGLRRPNDDTLEPA